MLTTILLATTAVSPLRPVSTYSIVARDPDTGTIGVAVQSHWFSVGPIVPWAEAGVGAVATQSLVDPAYGPLGLEHMRAGRSGPEALASLVAGDDGREVRQVAVIDAEGRVAAHTGARCIAAAGHVVDAAGGFSVQANLMENDTVWSAMADAYRGADGDLAARLLAALEAAESDGGDIRGRQSAALVVVSATATGRPWDDRLFDLRVEDHPAPLVELRRLVRLQRAYRHMNAGDVAMEHGDFEAAAQAYGAAEALAPTIVEIPFWHAVTRAGAGDLESALPLFRDVFEREPRWARLVPRLAASGFLPDDPALAERIRAEVPPDVDPAAPPVEVVVMGMIHGGHRTSPSYDIETVRSIIRRVDPDFILTEIPPERLEPALGEFRETGTVAESRVRLFPEYVDGLFPILDELDATVVGCAAWTESMARDRRERLERWRTTRPAETAAVERGTAGIEALLRAAGLGDDPWSIHDPAYDRIVAEGLEPYARHFGEDLGPGGWDNINTAHHALVTRAIAEHRRPGARFLVMFGAWHKHWLLERLRRRDDLHVRSLLDIIGPRPDDGED